MIFIGGSLGQPPVEMSTDGFLKQPPVKIWFLVAVP